MFAQSLRELTFASLPETDLSGQISIFSDVQGAFGLLEREVKRYENPSND
jgi:hypothetical protein